MTKLAVQVDNISKLYQLGTIGTGSLKRDLHRWWSTSVRNQADPFGLNSTVENESQASHIWALRKVNLDVVEGDVWGIVGGNGSGKSTLLKVISRIIRPTHGTVRGRGRLSSMLEVGTGFHQDLSGRENIYLSGYVLGMKRHEIRRRFDEIVEFSGIGQFVDTPVKRYSSGMYVRLAFAVAAHLDSDILIVDEVLAVGDAEFQKKCLAKMQEFTRTEGRTILFVSHNMQAVSQLCKHILWLKKGQVVASGPIQSILNQYSNQSQTNQLSQVWHTPEEAPGNHWIRLKSVELIPQKEAENSLVDVRTPLTLKFQFWVCQDELRLLAGFQLMNQTGECVFDIMTPFTDCKRGLVEATCEIPGNFLNDGSYSISLIAYRNSWEDYFDYQNCLSFDVEDFRGDGMNFTGKWWGSVRPKFPLTLVHKPENQPLRLSL
ncbi:ABC transporter ATP-binding protein [Spirosoma linguale]|uniref:ABC transporter related protein n=1 Tax=Spirosoma linguale (strain ATCC 33905 / DSM 74 / LMG 10896 / Claus 1) TaxID=504472 RepID=D2QGH4_SPILD|nr:ABC transporter related protein [Spirosoma linguale DSM 74]